jgi:hypothetical protein
MEILLCVPVGAAGLALVALIFRRVKQRGEGEIVEARLARYAGPGRW